MHKISFWGSPIISAKFLHKILESDFDVSYVVTQPDKARSKRGRRMEPSEVKKVALQKNLPVFTPEKLKTDDSFYHTIKKIPVDFHVILAYGKIIPANFFNIPLKGSVNFHASLLPRWRGASPIEAVLLHGENKTGWSLQKVTKKLDAGDVYSTCQVSISPKDNFISLYQKLEKELLIHGLNMLEEYAKGAIGQPQDPDKVTYFGKIEKSMLWTNWESPFIQVVNQCRAYEARGNRTQFRKKDIRISLNLEVPESEMIVGGGFPGKLDILENKLWVQCSSGRVMIEKIILPGKKAQFATDFIRGYKIQENDSFLKPESMDNN